eukprot:6176152-Pleurochrysis_carterae.AAC.3
MGAPRVLTVSQCRQQCSMQSSRACDCTTARVVLILMKCFGGLACYINTLPPAPLGVLAAGLPNYCDAGQRDWMQACASGLKCVVSEVLCAGLLKCFNAAWIP